MAWPTRTTRSASDIWPKCISRVAELGGQCRGRHGCVRQPSRVTHKVNTIRRLVPRARCAQKCESGEWMRKSVIRGGQAMEWVWASSVRTVKVSEDPVKPQSGTEKLIEQNSALKNNLRC